ncbi:MAG: hypothetical protein HKN16_02825 [Saprospiraceae bacterium]|nr:hypothetical protein [Saprospiraceae bacterium]
MDILLYQQDNFGNVAEVQDPDNPNGLCIVLGETEKTKESLDLLEKICTAANMSLAEAYVVSISGDARSSMIEWVNWGKCQQIWFLGIDPKHMGIHFSVEKYSPKQAGGKSIIFSDPLSELLENTEAKKKLWAAIKTELHGE